MPFRFRRSISFCKGLRLNISKGGFSTSLGVPGATLNIGKRGVRPTIGLPGTGLSFTPSQGSSTRTKKNALTSITSLTSIIIFAIVTCICSGCLVAYLLTDTNPIISTPVPIPTMQDIQSMIAGTSAAAQTQTQQAAPIIIAPLSTATLAPILDVPTATVFITVLQTNVAQPTEYIYSTNTPFALATYPLATAPSSGGGAVCSCSGDTLNCDNFSTHSSAQSCFSYCMSQGRGDVHKLDRDGNGSACESLP